MFFRGFPWLFLGPHLEKSSELCVYQKKPDVRNFPARSSGARNGCANFGAWHFLVLSARKRPCPEGGVEVPILFLWARGFSECKFRDLGMCIFTAGSSPRLSGL